MIKSMVKISPSDRITASELVENSYFDEIRNGPDIYLPCTKVVDANVEFTSAEEAAEFLVREIELLNNKK